MAKWEGDEPMRSDEYPEGLESLERELALLKRFYALWKAGMLYPGDHPMWRHACRQFLEAFTRLQGSRSGEFVLRIVGDEFYLEDTLLVRESILYYSLLQDLKKAGIGGVAVSPSVGPTDLAALVSAVREGEVLRASEDPDAFLRERNIHGIRLEKPGEWKEERGRGGDRTRLTEEYRNAVAVMGEISRQVEEGRRIRVDKARRVVSSLLERIKENRTAVLGLTSLKSHDDYTCYHSINVLILSLSLGTLLSLDRPALVALGMGALLHDLGKITVPREILQKKGPLTEGEWSIIRSHPVKGADILLAQPGIHPLSVAVAMEHHAHYDMGGYPKIRGKERPSLFSRIVEMADVYDAMTTTRPYQRARTPEQALRILLKDSGFVFDPALAPMFVAMMGIYPAGTLVRLSDGRWGVVSEGAVVEPRYPVVKVIADENGPLTRPFLLDLGGDVARERGLEVAEVLLPEEAGVDLEGFLDQEAP
jgi:HD-GYP domain-containing protein (c-di-GMP phosphodiesterase class II)